MGRNVTNGIFILLLTLLGSDELLEFIVISYVVGLIVELGSEHHEHRIGREVIHLSPHIIRDKKALVRSIEENLCSIVSVIEMDLAAAVNADKDLL